MHQTARGSRMTNKETDDAHRHHFVRWISDPPCCARELALARSSSWSCAALMFSFFPCHALRTDACSARPKEKVHDQGFLPFFGLLTSLRHSVAYLRQKHVRRRRHRCCRWTQQHVIHDQRFVPFVGSSPPRRARVATSADGGRGAPYVRRTPRTCRPRGNRCRAAPQGSCAAAPHGTTRHQRHQSIKSKVWVSSPVGGSRAACSMRPAAEGTADA